MNGLNPGFMLNLHDRSKNPCFESHDPSMMYDPVSGYCYSYSTDTAITSEYRQGIPVRKSKDLVNFEFVGYALTDKAIREGSDNGELPGTRGFWAPFCEYTCGEYRLYYSATKAFGSSESRIWLAVSSSPEGPFENRGVVVDTWGTDDTYPNAIDPHIIDTTEGQKYLVYGSFFGGIYLKELEPETGLALQRRITVKGADGKDVYGREEYTEAVKDIGIRIAHKPDNSHVDGPEGAAVIRVPETGYYYLFLSYGWLGDTYDIRVGRSRFVEGPYLDTQGHTLDGESPGLKIAGSYCFRAYAPYHGGENKDWSFGGFRGPGHGVPFYHPAYRRYFFVHHVRDGAEILKYTARNTKEKDSYRMHYMCIRSMYFVDGWPVLSPEPYAGEGKANVISSARFADIASENDMEWILFASENNGMVSSFVLSEEKLTGSKNDENGIPAELDLSDFRGIMGTAADFENFCSKDNRECMILAAYDSKGRTLWGKYHD